MMLFIESWVVADAGGFGHMGGWGWGMAVTGWLTMVLVVVLLVWSLRGGFDSSRPRQGSTQSAARRVLDERYALGDLDREEYLRRRADLDE